MAHLSASVCVSCPPPTTCLQVDAASSPCCPRNLNGYPLPVNRAVIADGAQEKSHERPFSPTKNSSMLAFCCKTPATCDATPVDAFEKNHAADSEARTAQLQSLLDKIDRESYKSIKCLKFTLDEVDRRIHSPSSCPLPSFTSSTRRQSAVCQCQSAARLFFYNRGVHREHNRRSSPLPSSSPYGSAVSEPPNIQGDAASVSSASVSSASVLLRPLTDVRQSNSVESSSVTTSASAPSASLLCRRSPPVPRKLESVFGGFSSIKRNSRKLCTRLQHAKKLITRVLSEAQASPNNTSSFAESKDTERATIRKALCLELLDDLESSVTTAERLNVQAEQLEQKSRRRLNDLHQEMLVRQKFKLSPWQCAVTRPSPVLLRAFSGLKNVDGAHCRRLKNATKTSAAGGNVEHTQPSTNTGVSGLSKATAAFRVDAIDRANWLNDLPFTGRESTDESQNKVGTGFSVYKNGRKSDNDYPLEIATLRGPLNTLTYDIYKPAKLSDERISMQKDAVDTLRYAEQVAGNTSQFAYYASGTEHTNPTAKNSFYGPATFTCSWGKKNRALDSSQRPRSHACIGQTEPHCFSHLSGLTNSLSTDCDSVATTSMLSRTTEAPCNNPVRKMALDGTTTSRTSVPFTWPSHCHLPHTHLPRKHACYNADGDPRKFAEIVLNGGRHRDSNVPFLPRNTVCLSSECGSRFLSPAPLKGACATDFCQSPFNRHDFAESLSLPAHGPGNRVSTASLRSHVPVPFSVGAGVVGGIEARQCGSIAAPYGHLSDAPLSRQFLGNDEQAERSPFAVRLGFLCRSHAPCASRLNGHRQGDTHFQSALASVCCRLLPSPSVSAENSSDDKNSKEEQPRGTFVH